ncbi:MAG: MBOAT family O-acyltransferase [Byssovorax sp.]
MLFNSFHYLAFYPLVLLVYFLTPVRMRWAPLLLASCYFYMAFIPKYILVLFAIILIDFFAAIGMESLHGAPAKKRLLLLVSILANLGILCVFKYFNFFADNVNTLAGRELVPALGLILPIGLSFHTFQSLSYTIEVYRGHVPAERHLGIYAVYVLYFPQMVAGPIERPQNILPQLHQVHRFSHERAVSGLRLILFGFIKKVVLADQLAAFVDRVYQHPGDHQGPALLAATYAFTFQIYLDFSGYSDIARGSSRLFGIELMRNFDSPYFATSLSEFWRRWHLSLSTWFRDYLYIPLGGNRVPPLRRALNLLIVFLVSGLWHGANWTFVIWGGIHGAVLAVSDYVRKGEKPRPGVLAWLLTFHIVVLSWVFFRAASIADAITVLRRMPLGWGRPGAMADLAATAGSASLYVLLGALLLAVLFVERRPQAPLFGRLLARPGLRWTAYYAALAILAFFGKSDAKKFIYFQF